MGYKKENVGAGKNTQNTEGMQTRQKIGSGVF